MEILLAIFTLFIVFVTATDLFKKEEEKDVVKENLGFKYLVKNAVTQEIPFLGYCYQRHNFYSINTKYKEVVVGVVDRKYSFNDEIPRVWVFCVAIDEKHFLIDRRWNNPALYDEGSLLEDLKRLYGKEGNLYKIIARDVKEGRAIECELNTSRIKSNIEKKLKVIYENNKTNN